MAQKSGRICADRVNSVRRAHKGSLSCSRRWEALIGEAFAVDLIRPNVIFGTAHNRKFHRSLIALGVGNIGK